jgi:hypothetical protein
MSLVRYELHFYIPEDGILHSHRREYLKSYKAFHCSDKGGFKLNAHGKYVASAM